MGGGHHEVSGRNAQGDADLSAALACLQPLRQDRSPRPSAYRGRMRLRADRCRAVRRPGSASGQGSSRSPPQLGTCRLLSSWQTVGHTVRHTSSFRSGLVTLPFSPFRPQILRALHLPPLIQQTASHSPDHQPLLRLYPQLVLDAVDSVPDRHRLVSPGLSYLRVGQPLRKDCRD